MIAFLIAASIALCPGARLGWLMNAAEVPVTVFNVASVWSLILASVAMGYFLHD